MALHCLGIMAKRHNLLDTPLSDHLKATKPANWDLCVLCQDDTGAALQCPVNNNVRAPTLDGYLMAMAANLLQGLMMGMA